MTRPVILQAMDIKKSYSKSLVEIPVVKGISFSIDAGEKVAITGASGVGKSTLLHILGTLEPPTSGKVFFEHQSIFEYSEKELALFRNKFLGFVFQFHYLLAEFTAIENVMMPALIAGYSFHRCYPQAKQLLEVVGLGHRLNHRPSELSGGEQQRVAIARAVVLRPKLLLADEPTGNLDSMNRTIVIDLLIELNKITQTAILLVTHDQSVALKMDRTLVMKDGQFVG